MKIIKYSKIVYFL